ncbi:MAG: polysaccharide biosynthesis C-terminal domain-containing protein, partial [Candidatus Methanoperedens sp.]|nr:polysaccharide biosynthesis C-terminal domain-containing protein [Candidatus Methanoperedens sp.]
RLSTFSFWLFLTSSGGMLYSYSDTVMISYYLNNVDVGVYRVMFQFSVVALFIANALGSVLWVKVSKWGKTNETGLIEESLSRAIGFSLLLALPILAGGILLGNELLYFFYGGEFAGGYPALIVLLFVQVVSIFQGFFISYLSALDRQKYAFRATAISGSANIVLNIILIPTIGITGAAIATLATMMLNAVLARRELSKVITIRMEQTTILNILKASAAMSVFLLVYRLFVPLSNIWLTLIPVILGGAIYGILILKLDSKIYNDLKEVVEQMNLTWPRWL